VSETSLNRGDRLQKWFERTGLERQNVFFVRSRVTAPHLTFARWRFPHPSHVCLTWTEKSYSQQSPATNKSGAPFLASFARSGDFDS
jgi:hypothetical protein